jgi:hypothetical protein
MRENLVENVARAMHAQHVGDNGPMWEDSWRQPYFMDMARVAIDVVTTPPQYDLIERLNEGLYCSCGDRLADCDPACRIAETFEHHVLEVHGLALA